MPPIICNHQLLLDSLHDKLSELQEETLAAHLENCDDCRAMLESLATGDDSWKKIESALRNETTGQLPSGRPRSTLVPIRPSIIDRPHSIGAEIDTTDFAVDFLIPAESPDALGRLNNIEVRAIIGHGGNGIVLKGFQEELNRLVAVKVMAPQLATSAAARKRFAREAQATAAIVHPCVMPILTVHSDGPLPYLVMPYIDCESLQDRIDREGALPLLDTLRIGHQVAKGLAAAHAQGLVHRDVKPANILLERGVDRVMLTDFGLARAVDDGTLTRTGLIAGTPQYMSPEQARGDAVDTRSDLFSFGSVLYAMCTGRAPFRAETTYGILRRVVEEQPRPIAVLNPDLPVWVEPYVRTLMAKAAASREESAEQIAGTLEQCVAHVQQPQAHSLPERIGACARSSRFGLRALMLTLGICALLTAAVITNSGLNSLPNDTAASLNHGSASDHGKTVIDQETGMTHEASVDNSANDQWASSIGPDLQQLEIESQQLLNSLSKSDF